MRRRGDDVETNLRNARSDHIDSASGGVRKIDDAAVDERSAICDSHVDGFSVGEIRDAYPRVERQRAMGGRQFFHVVNFTVGRGPSVIGMSIPARDAGFRALRRRTWRRRNLRRRRNVRRYSFFPRASGKPQGDRE